MDEVERIAKALTTGAKRACLGITADWQFAGRMTFNANGARALRWHSRSKPLADYELRKVKPSDRYSRPAYRLTPLGLAVRQFLQNQEGLSDGK